MSTPGEASSATAGGPTPLVLAADVLVSATTFASATWKTWPATPPGSRNSAADCLGIVAEPGEWALWLSDDLLLAVVQPLLDPQSGLGWNPGEVRRYVTVLRDIASASGGGLIAHPPEALGRRADLPLRAPLDLAAFTTAPVVVSDWSGLLRLNPCKGPSGRLTHVLSAHEFRRRVDAARRAAGGR